MYDSYDEIFNKRGLSYHKAMQLAPMARAKEFLLALEGIPFSEGDKVFDIPSGGGYLEKFLPRNLELEYIAIDPSESFANTWAEHRHKTYYSPLEHLPVDDDCADKILSIAGLHHVKDLLPVFNEMKRVLRPQGILSILEVSSGSMTDKFLNVFVDNHNSMGHTGTFIDNSFRMNLLNAGFTILSDEASRYTWDFSNEDQMVSFIKLMFGLDKADNDIIRDNLGAILGISNSDKGVSINWELQHIIAS